MHKILGIIFLILGLIAVVGSVIYFIALTTIGQVITTAATDPAIAQQAGVDAQGLSEVLGLLSTFLTLGWIWGVSILVSGLAAFWFGLRIMRSKSK